MARHASLLGWLAPLREPEVTLRLACYLGALALFSLLTLLRYLGIELYGRVYGVVVLACLCTALALLFVACRSLFSASGLSSTTCACVGVEHRGYSSLSHTLKLDAQGQGRQGRPGGARRW